MPVDPEIWQPQPDEWWSAVVKIVSSNTYLFVTLSNGEDVYVARKTITRAPIHTCAVIHGSEASVRVAPSTVGSGTRWFALELQVDGAPSSFTEIAEITHWKPNAPRSGYGSGRLLQCNCPVMIAWARDTDIKVGDIVKLNVMFSQRRQDYVGVDAQKIKATDSAPLAQREE